MESLKVNDDRIYSIIVLYDMQTKFFKSALDGISDADSHKRLETKANHIAWLTGSLVQQRFEIANMFGIDGNQAANDLFKDNQGIKDGQTYPPLSSMIKDWEYISPLLREALVTATAEKYDSTFEMMPGMMMSNFDLVSFVTYREANCIGQIALWRRLLGYEAMKYM
jgi:hypothetical protein